MSERDKRLAACVHFNGCMRGCAVGVDLLSFNGGESYRMALKLPCHGPTPIDERYDPQTCEKYTPHTSEQLDEEDAYVDRILKGTRLARKEIVKHIEAGGSDQGLIECPVCKTGKLSYSRARINGHIHAGCSTPECVRWME